MTDEIKLAMNLLKAAAALSPGVERVLRGLAEGDSDLRARVREVLPEESKVDEWLRRVRG